MINTNITVINRLGLHARAATKLAKLANSYPCSIRAGQVEPLVDAKSVMSLMLLAANQGFSQRKKEKLVAFDMDNVADIEDNLVDVDMSQYEVYEEVVVPDDDNIDDYEVVREDDTQGIEDMDDPTVIIEPTRGKGKGMRM